MRPLPPIIEGGINPAYLREVIGGDASMIAEIGANDGSHTLQLLTLFPNATVFAFEPDPRALQKFKTNVTDRRARLFEMAIGATDGHAQFHVSSGVPPAASADFTSQFPQGWDQSSSLRAPKTHSVFWPWCKFESKITVPVKRLDSWARDHGVDHLGLVWADMQGAEGDLIAGGPATLAKTRYLYTEYSNHEWYEGQPTLQQQLDLLPNFAIVHLFTMDVLLRNTAIGPARVRT